MVAAPSPAQTRPTPHLRRPADGIARPTAEKLAAERTLRGDHEYLAPVELHERAIATWADWALAQTEGWRSTTDPGPWDHRQAFA